MPTANSRTPKRIRAEHRRDRALQPCRQRLGAKHRVEHDLDRPRLEQAGARLGADGGEAKEQDAPVAGQQAKDCGSVGLRIQRRRVVGQPVCLEGVPLLCKYAPGSAVRGRPSDPRRPRTLDFQERLQTHTRHRVPPRVGPSPWHPVIASVRVEGARHVFETAGEIFAGGSPGWGIYIDRPHCRL